MSVGEKLFLIRDTDDQDPCLCNCHFQGQWVGILFCQKFGNSYRGFIKLLQMFLDYGRQGSDKTIFKKILFFADLL